MHELAITADILDAVSRQAAAAGATRVTRVTVEIGRLAAVLPAAIKLCFTLCSEETALAGAELVLVETAGAELRIIEMEVM